MKKLVMIIFVCILSSCVIIPNAFEVDSFSIKGAKLEFSSFGEVYSKFDAFSLPDIYFAIYDVNNNIVKEYSNYDDVTPGMFPLNWKSTDMQYKNKEYYSIKIYDKDIAGSDLIAESIIQRINCKREDQQILFVTSTGEKLTLTLSPHYRKVE